MPHLKDMSHNFLRHRVWHIDVGGSVVGAGPVSDLVGLCCYLSGS